MPASARKTIRTVFNQMPDELLLCWDIGHDWPRYRVPAKPIRGGWERIYICGRCELHRIQEINKRGYIIRTRYSHRDPEARLIGHGHITGDTRAIMRMVSVNRSIMG